jgi:integrase
MPSSGLESWTVVGPDGRAVEVIDELLASTGMRVGQALGLRHEDVVSWERRIEIVAREGASGRARSKGGAQGSVPVPGELIRLWSDYMHEEYGDWSRTSCS